MSDNEKIIKLLEEIRDSLERLSACVSQDEDGYYIDVRDRR
jgi:hypothetical protein